MGVRLHRLAADAARLLLQSHGSPGVFSCADQTWNTWNNWNTQARTKRGKTLSSSLEHLEQLQRSKRCDGL